MSEQTSINEAKRAASNDNDSSRLDVMDLTLRRLARGIPRSELKLMVAEAERSEEEIIQEIELLEKALNGEEVDTKALDIVVEATLTPLEKCWTLSALLGRLRGDLAMPSMLKKDGSKLPTPPAKIEECMTLVDLLKDKAYNMEHETPANLLAIWKKIHTHRSALVFKKAVRVEEAPGYTDRISFPMDLSLVRKLIITRKIKSYADLHKYVALISHNCVKYNGRESDYGLVAREFEAMADEAIRQAVSAASKSGTLKDPPPGSDSTATASLPGSFALDATTMKNSASNWK
jgi:hypothetical protein